MGRHHRYQGHIRFDANAPINCETQGDRNGERGYPVLHIGEASIFPSRDQLVTLLAKVGAWLEANEDGSRLVEAREEVSL